MACDDSYGQNRESSLTPIVRFTTGHWNRRMNIKSQSLVSALWRRRLAEEKLLSNHIHFKTDTHEPNHHALVDVPGNVHRDRV